MTVLDAHGVAYTIDGAPLLEEVSLSVRAGQIVAIIGPNGAGKTTFLRALAGLIACEGAVTIDQASVAAMPSRARARRIAFVASVNDHFVETLTVREVVAQGRYAHREHAFDRSSRHEHAIDRALTRTGLATFGHRRLAGLSCGERRRAWIALGLSQAADVLLLDEPTANLDLHHAQQTLALLRELADDGRAIVAIFHDLNEAAQIADEIALLDQGRLIALGPPSEVLTPERISASYRVTVDVITAADGKLRVFPRL